MSEKVFYVPRNGDPYDHYRYVCGPNKDGMYASCQVFPLDDGRTLVPGAMRMVHEGIFADEIEVERCEAGRVIAAVNRKRSAH